MAIYGQKSLHYHPLIIFKVAIKSHKLSINIVTYSVQEQTLSPVIYLDKIALLPLTFYACLNSHPWPSNVYPSSNIQAFKRLS
jgi:hypothetical protein